MGAGTWNDSDLTKPKAVSVCHRKQLSARCMSIPVIFEGGGAEHRLEAYAPLAFNILANDRVRAGAGFANGSLYESWKIQGYKACQQC